MKKQNKNIFSIELYETILSCIQDGISILDRDFNVIYMNKAMKHWYPDKVHQTGDKCYRIFHDRDTYCSNCPSLRAIGSLLPQMELMPYTTMGKDVGWQNLYSVPVLNKKGEVILIIECIRNITEMINEIFSMVKRQQSTVFESLSSRELQIAEMIEKGLSSKEIASALFVTKKTVDFHRSNIRKKLGLKDKSLRTWLVTH